MKFLKAAGNISSAISSKIGSSIGGYFSIFDKSTAVKLNAKDTVNIEALANKSNISVPSIAYNQVAANSNAEVVNSSDKVALRFDNQVAANSNAEVVNSSDKVALRFDNQVAANSNAEIVNTEVVNSNDGSAFKSIISEPIIIETETPKAIEVVSSESGSSSELDPSLKLEMDEFEVAEYYHMKSDASIASTPYIGGFVSLPSAIGSFGWNYGKYLFFKNANDLSKSATEIGKNIKYTVRESNKKLSTPDVLDQKLDQVRKMTKIIAASYDKNKYHVAAIKYMQDLKINSIDELSHKLAKDNALIKELVESAKQEIIDNINNKTNNIEKQENLYKFYKENSFELLKKSESELTNNQEYYTYDSISNNGAMDSTKMQNIIKPKSLVSGLYSKKYKINELKIHDLNSVFSKFEASVKMQNKMQNICKKGQITENLLSDVFKGYEIIDSGRSIEEKLNVKKDDLSNVRSIVLKKEDSNEFVISLPGTHIVGLQAITDLGADLRLAGGFSAQLNNLQRLIDNIYQYLKADYNITSETKITLVGHSLGGHFAQFVKAYLMFSLKHSKVDLFTFDSPGSEFALKDFYMGDFEKMKTTIATLDQEQENDTFHILAKGGKNPINQAGGNRLEGKEFMLESNDSIISKIIKKPFTKFVSNVVSHVLSAGFDTADYIASNGAAVKWVQKLTTKLSPDNYYVLNSDLEKIIQKLKETNDVNILKPFIRGKNLKDLKDFDLVEKILKAEELSNNAPELKLALENAIKATEIKDNTWEILPDYENYSACVEKAKISEKHNEESLASSAFADNITEWEDDIWGELAGEQYDLDLA